MKISLRDKLLDLPKADLHVHLSGSLYPTDIRKIYKLLKFNVKEFEPLEKYMNFFNPTVWRVLKKIMTNPEGITAAVKCAMGRQKDDGISKSEVIINTGSMLDGTLNTDFLFKRLNFVLESSTSSFQVDMRIRLGVNRRNGPKAVLDTAELYKKYKTRFIVGIDLNGDEKRYPTSIFIEALNKIKSERIPFTIHAGEYLELTDSLDDAISVHPNRIGHGIAAVNSKALMDKLTENNIVLEICLVGNVKTNSVKSLKQHPVLELINHGVPVVLATDNPGMFNSTLTDQYMHLYELGVSFTQLKEIAKRSLSS